MNCCFITNTYILPNVNKNKFFMFILCLKAIKKLNNIVFFFFFFKNNIKEPVKIK